MYARSVLIAAALVAGSTLAMAQSTGNSTGAPGASPPPPSTATGGPGQPGSPPSAPSSGVGIPGGTGAGMQTAPSGLNTTPPPTVPPSGTTK